jgi:hypothetical protein
VSDAVRHEPVPDLELSMGFSPLRVGKLSEERTALWETLPSDYRKFLRLSNGGWAEEFRYNFPTGVPWEQGGKRIESIEDSPREFFGFKQGRSAKGHPRDLLDAVIEHAAEEFLPELLIPVAVCGSSSLVCLSLREDSYGSIWYWDWYWRYPWRGDFFSKRIEEARRASAHLVNAQGDSESPEHAELADALNFATVVRLADSFTAWVESFREASSGDA